MVGAILFSSVVGYVAYLCSWQLKRYEWKISLVQLRTDRLRGDARTLAAYVGAADLADAERLAAVVEEEEFRRVAVRGEFDHTQQMLLGPRSAPPGAKQHLAPGGSPSGWDVVTPLRCDDGSVVLVNRGWVPRETSGGQKGALGQPAALDQPRGVQEVHGVLKRGEQRSGVRPTVPGSGRAGPSQFGVPACAWRPSVGCRAELQPCGARGAALEPLRDAAQSRRPRPKPPTSPIASPRFGHAGRGTSTRRTSRQSGAMCGSTSRPWPPSAAARRYSSSQPRAQANHS